MNKLKKWKKILIIISTFLLLLNLIGVKVIYDIYTEKKDLEKSYEEQLVFNNNLQTDFDDNIENTEEIEGKVEELEITIKDLEVKLSDFETIEEEMNELLEAHDTLITEKEEYLNEIKELKNKVNRLSSSDTISKNSSTNATQTYTPISGKVAYLTFDDGPSSHTKEILDILKSYNVKATFFVLGSNIRNEAILKDIVNEGHSLGNHTHSHEYSYIYQNDNNFWEDFLKAEERIHNVAGQRPKIMRFPGGSNNKVHEQYTEVSNLMVKIKEQLGDSGYIFHDWNVSSGDASGNNVSKDKLVANALNTKGYNAVNILMHDIASKKTTVEALPEIIEGLQKQGYEFKAITESTKPVQFR